MPCGMRGKAANRRNMTRSKTMDCQTSAGCTISALKRMRNTISNVNDVRWFVIAIMMRNMR